MKSVIQCQKVSKIDLHVSKVVGTHSFHFSLCKGRLTSGARSKMLRDGFLCRHFKSGCGVGLPAVLGAWVFVRATLRMQHFGQNKEDFAYQVYLFRVATNGKSGVFI